MKRLLLILALISASQTIPSIGFSIGGPYGYGWGPGWGYGWGGYGWGPGYGWGYGYPYGGVTVVPRPRTAAEVAAKERRRLEKDIRRAERHGDFATAKRLEKEKINLLNNLNNPKNKED
ncbi:MAG TPA: hypothetical protein VLG50_06960 [Candidatus Saccharimonadales bacterium]|nr:hypothetical protein [Candidatus Saccharimonadales bacterium]